MSDKGEMAVMTEKDTDLTEQQKEELKIYPFRNVIGKLWWITLISRPDIVYAVHRCACYQNKPSKKLWMWLLRILRYLKHTKNLGLVYERKNFNPKQILVGYCDASFLSEERSLHFLTPGASLRYLLALKSHFGARAPLKVYLHAY